MKEMLLKVLLVLVVALFIAGVLSIKFSVWEECRATHGFFYCWHLMGG